MAIVRVIFFLIVVLLQFHNSGQRLVDDLDISTDVPKIFFLGKCLIFIGFVCCCSCGEQKIKEYAALLLFIVEGYSSDFIMHPGRQALKDWREIECALRNAEILEKWKRPPQMRGPFPVDSTCNAGGAVVKISHSMKTILF